MQDCCPCCGHIIEGAELKVSLEFNTLIHGSRAIALKAKECELVYALHKAWPHSLPTSRIIHAVWGSVDIPTDMRVRNLVHTTRKPLSEIGYTIRYIQVGKYRLERIQHMAKKLR